MKAKTIIAACGCEISNTKKYKEKNTCKKCGHLFCSKHLYFYVDGNNESITKYSPLFCEECYNETYKNK